MQPARCASKERRFLFEVNTDTAEEDRRAGALILFIQRQRQVERHHQGLVAQLAQCGDERVIAEAAPAIHWAGAGSELQDVHLEGVGHRYTVTPLHCYIVTWLHGYMGYMGYICYIRRRVTTGGRRARIRVLGRSRRTGLGFHAGRVFGRSCNRAASANSH